MNGEDSVAVFWNTALRGTLHAQLDAHLRAGSAEGASCWRSPDDTYGKTGRGAPLSAVRYAALDELTWCGHSFVGCRTDRGPNGHIYVRP